MTDRPDCVLLTLPRQPLRDALAGARFVEAADGAGLDPAERPAVRSLITGGMQKIGPEEMDLLPNLGLIVTIGAGFDGVDLPAAQTRGIGLATGTGINAEETAEGAVALFLAAARRVVSNDARVRSGAWEPGELRPVRSIGATKVGVVAMGAIGKAIAARLVPFHCPIRWNGPNPKPEVEFPYVPDLLELARWADALIVAAPLNPETRGLISAEVIDAVGPEGLLVNIGRGGLVDEDALIAALKDGRLGGAALDVFYEEPTPPARWAGVPNTVLSPHTAGVTHQSMAAIVNVAARRAKDFLRDAPPRKA